MFKYNYSIGIRCLNKNLKLITNVIFYKFIPIILEYEGIPFGFFVLISFVFLYKNLLTNVVLKDLHKSPTRQRTYIFLLGSTVKPTWMLSTTRKKNI